MINFDKVTKENTIIHTINCPYIPDHCREY